MSANETLLTPSRVRGWRLGLANMLGKEMSGWWRTRRWWIQCLLALALLNVTLALNIDSGQPITSAGLNFLIVAGFAAPIAAISLGQDAILGERHSGTAAWVLSKPLRRPAFILAKLIAHALGFLATWLVLPGTLAYFQITANGLPQLSQSGWVGAVGLIYLNVFFYLTLALMLATLFNGRGPVLGITLLILFSGPIGLIDPSIQDYAPWLMEVLPWRLVMPIGAEPPLAGYLAMGAPLPTVIPIVATALWCVLFAGVAIWRMRREEF